MFTPVCLQFIVMVTIDNISDTLKNTGWIKKVNPFLYSSGVNNTKYARKTVV